MIDPANRLYALDLLHRAGTAYDARDISVIASILPLVEADIIAAVEKPIGDGTTAAQAIIAARIGTGCHRPETEPPGSLTSRPGQPAAAPATVHAGGDGLSTVADTPDVETMKRVDGEQMQLAFELCDEFRKALFERFPGAADPRELIAIGMTAGVMFAGMQAGHLIEIVRNAAEFPTLTIEEAEQL